MIPPEYCPHCGASVPPHARACPECGSDESTGWSDHASRQSLDLPDDEFDYEEFIRQEFKSHTNPNPIKPKNLAWIWWIMALILVLVLLRPILQWLEL